MLTGDIDIRMRIGARYACTPYVHKHWFRGSTSTESLEQYVYFGS